MTMMRKEVIRFCLASESDLAHEAGVHNCKLSLLKRKQWQDFDVIYRRPFFFCSFVDPGKCWSSPILLNYLACLVNSVKSIMDSKRGVVASLAWTAFKRRRSSRRRSIPRGRRRTMCNRSRMIRRERRGSRATWRDAALRVGMVKIVRLAQVFVKGHFAREC